MCRERWAIVVAIIFGLAETSAVVGADGQLDPTFGSGGIQVIQVAAQQRDFAKAVAVQPDGKIVIGAELGDYTLDTNQVVLIRLNANGSLDTTFGTGGKIINPGQIHIRKILIQPDGKILAAGATQKQQINHDFSIVRYNSDGSVDQTFGNNGVATNGGGESEYMILQPDGRIILIGTFFVFRDGADYRLARFNNDGTPDQSFGVAGAVQTSFTTGRTGGDSAFAAALQSDGKIVTTGNANCISPGLIRYHTDGRTDTTFGQNGTTLTPSFGAITNRVLIDPDGGIIVGGGNFVVGRYTSNGAPDTAFGTDGKTVGGTGFTSATSYDMTFSLDGKVLVTGSVVTTSVSDTAIFIERFNSDGNLDPAFGQNGAVVTNITNALDEAFAITPYDKTRFVVVGYTAEPGATYVDVVAARYTSSTMSTKPRQRPR